MKTDIEIQQEVIAAFCSEASLNSADIGVSVHNGVVALCGQVDAYSKKITAQQVVWHIKEVRAVTVDIKIVLPSEPSLTDTGIAEDVLKALWLYSPAAMKRIRVKVELGLVYLEGETDTNDQKDAVINAAWYVANVKDVIATIIIKPAPSVSAETANPAVKKRKIIRGEWFCGYEDEMDMKLMAY